MHSFNQADYQYQFRNLQPEAYSPQSDFKQGTQRSLPNPQDDMQSMSAENQKMKTPSKDHIMSTNEQQHQSMQQTANQVNADQVLNCNPDEMAQLKEELRRKVSYSLNFIPVLSLTTLVLFTSHEETFIILEKYIAPI